MLRGNRFNDLIRPTQILITQLNYLKTKRRRRKHNISLTGEAPLFALEGVEAEREARDDDQDGGRDDADDGSQRDGLCKMDSVI